MLFTTSTQFAVLALCLIAGWLFGLASHPGGRRAKERLREVEAEHAAYRRDADARIKAAETERDRLARAAPVTAATVGTPVAASAATPAGGGIKGFFGWGRDNLGRIRGIDSNLESRLNAEGLKTYHQVETMSAEDEAELERRIGLSAGTIAAEHWRDQAAMLREGREDEHDTRFARR